MISNRSRINKARRLYKQAPLFAFQELKAFLEGDYTFEQFLSDLRPRRKPKPKTKQKSGLAKYGRYHRMMDLVARWNTSKDFDALYHAQVLRNRISQPYTLLVRYSKESREYFYRPEVPITHLETVVKLSKECSSHVEFEEKKKALEQYLCY